MMTKADRNKIDEWERAEIERSASEATHKDQGSLKFTQQNIARYLDPPAGTCYPHEYCFHVLGDVRGKRVLDFGCGDGENTVMLAIRGARVVGMDISKDLIEVARQRLAVNGVSSPVQFFVSSGHSVALSNESLDVVFGIAILHHLDLPQVAREVERLLRPGGQAIFLEPVRNSPTMRRLRALIPYRAPDVSPYERPLTDEELQAFGARFRHFESRPFALPYIGLVSIVPFLQGLLHPAFRFDGRVLKRFPWLGYWATARVVRMFK